MTTTSIYCEKIILTSGEDSTPLVFEDAKQLEINFDFSRPLIDTVIGVVEEWLTRIESDREMYSITPIPPTDMFHGGVSLRYRHQEIGKLFLKRTKKKDTNGNKILASAVFNVNTYASQIKF